jgi:16S rRNA (guanine966-N2)-methyltransferase
MRITGGTARGRNLIGPPGKNPFLRPTTDRVREAVFDILGDLVTGATVADLYSGTGAYGLEALSRGAERVVFADNSTRAMELLTKNCQRLFPEADVHAFLLDVSKKSGLEKVRNRLEDKPLFDLVFLDPPYKQGLAEKTLKLIDASEFAAPDGMVIVEEHKSVNMPESLNKLHRTDQRQYGESTISFYALP